MIASTIGLDLAKHNFHVHAVGVDGAVINTQGFDEARWSNSSRLLDHASLV